MKFKVGCTECGEKFSTNVWPPKSCPACGYIPDPDDDDRICMPSIKTMRTKSIDSTYREIEAASEQRVLQAAEMAGCDPSEMASLKITNLNDRRDAEIAAIPVNNVVTQQMDYVNARGGHLGFQGGNGAEYGTDIHTGAVTVDGRVVATGVQPNAGIRARNSLQRALPPVRSELPGLETQQPGYRRRG